MVEDEGPGRVLKTAKDRRKNGSLKGGVSYPHERGRRKASFKEKTEARGGRRRGRKLAMCWE